MFSYVELPVERPDRFALLGRPVTTDVRSNARPFDGRVYVMVLDDSTSVRSAPPSSKSRHANSSSSILAPTISPPSCIPVAAPMPRRTSRTTAICWLPHRQFVGRRLQSAAIEALEKHYYREFIRLDRRTTKSMRRCHHRHGLADQHAGSRARAACARGARHAAATSASSSPASADGERPCCCSARASNYR